MTRWLALAALLAAGCGRPTVPTPGGLVVEYKRGAPRLPPEKLAELDARHVELLACIPPTTKRAPVVRISGACDRVLSGMRSEYGATFIRIPPSLGAAAHEMAHYYTGDRTHTGWTLTCGDRIDSKYRRLHPPNCPDTKRP